MDPQVHPQRPPYPSLQTTSSQSSSAQQSTSSISSVSSHNAMFLAMPSPQHGGPCASAPLPSPTTQQPGPFFGSLHPQQHQQHSHSQPQYTHQWQSQSYSHHGGQVARSSNHYQQQPAVVSPRPHEAARHLSEVNLLAEAVKRAQMAVLMRDLEEIELR